MNVERHEELRLAPALDREIAELIGRVFPTDFGGRSFFQNRHHARFLVRVGGTLAGHLAVCHRAVRLGYRVLDVLGIAEVAVDPAFRRRGIGVALVEAALREGRAAGVDAVLLFGVESIYARAGFVAVKNPITRIDMRGVRTGEIVREEAEHLMVHPLGESGWDATAPLDLAGFTF
ncbi:GNAT family N-acetyltransferase [Phycisphaera mikurensis]|uniref:Putative acetyltransferase n=1 Tax=Phycisphaera mikurensis (strain NBRC 102666 / KCTC 22515 / FYK2301M01) TaxID=1142394 RepID=I0IDU9_PHYMF|nr:GNAT family N-acetyltransferase [Phycisphaera mikurensis]MBB6441247.1 putative N-acetyltransferase YhbS [Phycisphaera mikurensis]BAM03437.1 putative acetyltransferase [Phycisphaera mikurensis NBRC 102666]